MPENQRSGKFARFAWLVAAYNLPVVLWGAYVRATGSGAGCGNHWPLCNGVVIPQSPGIHTIIEFSHRATTAVDTVLVVWMAFWAFRAFARGHAARRAAALSVVFLLTEGLLGALLVKLDGTSAHTAIECVHMLNTLTLLAFLALTGWFGMGRPAPQWHGRTAWTAGLTLAAVMLLATTGAIAALGDTLFPPASLAAGLAQDFDPASSLLLRLRGLHPLFAAGVGAWLTVYAVGRLRSARTEALGVIVLVWAQLFAGLLNLVLRAPVWLQLVHLLLADSLWITLVLLAVSPRESGKSL